MIKNGILQKQIHTLEKKLYESISSSSNESSEKKRVEELNNLVKELKKDKNKLNKSLHILEREYLRNRKEIYSYLSKIKTEKPKKTDRYFDPNFYSLKYKIPSSAARYHYKYLGFKLNRNYSPYYDSNHFEKTTGIRDYPAESYFQHAINFSIPPNELFDPLWYRNKYRDVEQEGIEPLFHYIHYGWKELRNPSAFFNTKMYLEKYEDVKESNIEPLSHYLLYGKREGRKKFLVV